MQKRQVLQTRNIVIWTLMFTAVSLNQASIFLGIIVWRFELLYYLILAFASSAIFSLAARNAKISLFFVFASIIVGAVVSFGLLTIPHRVYGGGEELGVLAEIHIMLVARLTFFAIPVNVLGVILGSLINDGF